MATKKNKKISLGLFFWIAFIALIFLLFFINKDNIKYVLKKTNAKDLLPSSISQNGENKNMETELLEIQNEIEKINTETKDDYFYNDEQKQKTAEKLQVQKTDTFSAEGNKKLNEKTETAQPANKSAVQNKTTDKKNGAYKNSETKNTKRSASIFFAIVQSNGKITRKAVKREMEKTDSPLSDCIQALLKGPTLEEAKKGIRSFIPPDTKLLSAHVEHGTAVINFSEDFQFNRYGIEAYYAQLSQIVFTASEFPTVKSVQFLIDGQKKDYLGGEGIWIGSPISQSEFE